MLSRKSLTSLAFAALLLFSDTIAAPHSGKPNVSAKITKRDDPSSSSSTGSSTNGTTAGTNETATLQPVIPPDVNQDALSTLLLGTNVTLAWAGAPNSTAGSKRKLKRDEGVLSTATFTFKYPTVPLDHSNFISNVACSGNTLTAVLTDAAYTFAKSRWASVSDIVFVTSVDGCGMDNANDFFHATSISFSDSTKSFSATGASAGPKDVSTYMVLEWGAVPASTKLKRSSTKEEMFESHSLRNRGTHEIGIDVPFRAYAHELLGSDMDAPWDNAWKIGEISKGEGEEDDSYKKGEVASADGHHRRSASTNETSLGLYTRSEIEKAQEEGGFSYGMALYCVDCGFEGQAGLYGRLETDWFDIVGLGAGFRMDFKAGIYLGVVAYVKYEKEWPKHIAHVNLAGWEIPVIISVGPFIDVSLVPSFEIKASGALLIGAGIEWDNVDIYLDFLHPIDNSYAHNLVPSFQHRLEAAGEVGVEAKLALPVKLGLELKILQNIFTDDWIFNAEAAIVEEPAIVAEGKFEVSAEITDDGEIEYDINGGCYGIAWDIHFENELYFEATADFFGLGGEHTWPLLSFESDPFAEGCIGYVNDGTDDNSDDPQGTGDSTGMGGNGLNSDGNGLAGSSNGNSQDSGSSNVQVVKAQVVQSSSTSTSSSSSSTSSSSSSTRTSTTLSTSTSTSSSSSTTSKSSTSSPVQNLAAATTTSSTSTTSKTSTTTSSSSSSTTTKSSTTSTTSSTSKTSTSTSSTSTKPTTTSTTSSSTSSTSKSTSTTPQVQAATTTSKTSTTSSTTSSKSSTTSSSSSTKTTSTTSPVQAQQTTSKTSTTSTKPTTTSTSSSTTSKPTTTSTTSSTKTTSTSTSTTPACTASVSAVAKTPTPTSTITCKSTATAAAVPTAAALNAATTANTADICATNCLKNTKCLSFSYVDSSKSCQLYTKAVKNLGTTTKSGNPTMVFWDRDCYAYNTCPAK